MSEAPDEIWLQIGDDESCTYEGAVKAGAEISWCAEEVFPGIDIRYIRADLADAPEQETAPPLSPEAFTGWVLGVPLPDTS